MKQSFPHICITNSTNPIYIDRAEARHILETGHGSLAYPVAEAFAKTADTGSTTLMS
jgi:hypothetical protein